MYQGEKNSYSRSYDEYFNEYTGKKRNDLLN